MNANLKTKNCVYCAYNKINGKRYIGYTTTSLSRRITAHYHQSRNNKSNNYFHSALKKHRKEDFIWYVLFISSSLDALRKREIELIALLKSNKRRHGYNSTTGGEKSYFNDSVKKKISLKANQRNLKGINNPFFGKTHSEETKKQLSEKRKGILHNPGYKHSDEVKQNLSILRKEICKNPLVIENMRKAQKSRAILHISSGKKFRSINEASRQLNMNKSTIRKKALKNFEFRFCS